MKMRVVAKEVLGVTSGRVGERGDVVVEHRGAGSCGWEKGERAREGSEQV